MKKTVLILFIIIFVILFFLVTRVTKEEKPVEKVITKSQIFRKDLPDHLQGKPITTAFKDPEYLKAVVEIAKAAKRNGLSRQDLMTQAQQESSRELFLKKLPPDVRNAYLLLNRSLDQMKLLAAEKVKLQRPENFNFDAWIQLGPELLAFVEEKKSWRSISEADVQEVIGLCGAERRCVEKAIKIWTDAGQKLTPRQWRMISEVR